MKHGLASWALIAGILQVNAATAQDIPPAYQQAAIANGIPADIFYAVALAESGRDIGRYHPLRPWPWTLNIHGEGIYYNDRQSAWRAAVASIAKQQTSVDIGLMQVNWRYHRHRLMSPWRALDPHANLQVAAEILKYCQQRLADWWASVGCYHSPSNVERALRYRERVRAHWRALIKR
jgi:soluble lytic murein transglycosylase-like protein